MISVTEPPGLTYRYDGGPANGHGDGNGDGSGHDDGSGNGEPRWRRAYTRPWEYWNRDPDRDKPGLLERTGNLLIFLTSADRRKIESFAERQRYITIGLLMLVTAAQGFYSASLFAAIGFGKHFGQVLGFGIFFAVAVYLIDRSIIGYVAPVKLDKKGEIRPPRKLTPVMLIRILIAMTAAILMSEMILLQFFAKDIQNQILQNHLAETTHVSQAINNTYQQRINVLQNQINAAKNTVSQDQAVVKQDQQQANCQEFGCPGIAAGRGPGFRNAEKNLNDAQTTLGTAQTNLANITSANTPQITKLDNQLQNATSGADQTITGADVLLSREEAFWQLTTRYGTVAVGRILLSLLILGIDLAPILAKMTGRATMHDVTIQGDDYLRFRENREHVNTGIGRSAGQGNLDRERHSIEMETGLLQAKAHAMVQRYGMKLHVDMERRRLHRFYMSGPSQAAAGPRQPTATYTQPGERIGRHGAGPDPNGPDPTGPDPYGPDPNGPDPNGPTVGPQSAGGPYPAPGTFTQEFRESGFPLPPASGPGARRRAESGYGFDAVEDEIAGLLFDLDESTDHRVLEHRWELLGPLPNAEGGGGGIVWRARDRLGEYGRLVVKTVPVGTVDMHATERLRSFQNEERAKGIVSDHIGKILHCGVDQGLSYIVYPLYEPGSLLRYCQAEGSQRTLRWCAEITHQVLTGLMDAFQAGLVHLDIKPDNVVLDSSLDRTRARIIDWGLSRVWNAATITSTSVVRGTPFYACPEQFRRREASWRTPAADLYGVGAVFYWLITNEPPLQYDAGPDADMFTFMNLIVQGSRPQPVHELVRGVPEALGELIDHWLSYDPAARVPAGTPSDSMIRVARDELGGLWPQLPVMTVGAVTGRRRKRGRNS